MRPTPPQQTGEGNLLSYDGVTGLRASTRMRNPMATKQTPAARSIQWRACWKRRMTGADDMKRLTIEYQTTELSTTRPIIRAISQAGVLAVTAVAKTLANSTIALGLVRVTTNPNTKALPRTGRRTSSSFKSSGLAR